MLRDRCTLPPLGQHGVPGTIVPAVDSELNARKAHRPHQPLPGGTRHPRGRFFAARIGGRCVAEASSPLHVSTRVSQAEPALSQPRPAVS